jgi:GNAT superfamily N-acetyltransferase
MVPKGLPRNPVGAVLLARLGVDQHAQGTGVGARLLALARRVAAISLGSTGGIRLVVEAASDDLIGFHEKFGFRLVSAESRRLFLPTRSLLSD